MKLISLELNNFKNISHFRLETDLTNKNVYGKNGVGKTTLADAYYWVLVDKSSRDKKIDDDIKLKDTATGNPKIDHGIEHSVECVLELDSGSNVSLKKIYMEKWTKQQGKADREFSGHITKYYIDDVSRSKKDYQNYINEKIADSEILKMVSSTVFFNNMPWKKQREILLDVCGDISDDDVIASDEQLRELPDILNGKSVNDFIAITQERKSKINKELDTIPVRIDESSKALEALELTSKDALENELNSLKHQQDKAKGQIVAIQNGTEVAKLKNEISSIDLKMDKIKNDYIHKASSDGLQKKEKAIELKNKIEHNLLKIKEYDKTVNENNYAIEEATKKLEEYRNQYTSFYGTTFDEKKAICPTCGQVLPQEKIDEAIKKFNTDRANNLKSIAENGKKLDMKIKNMQSQNDELSQRIRELLANNGIFEGDKEELEKEAAELLNNADTTKYLDDENYINLRQQKISLSKDLSDMMNNIISKTSALNTTVTQLDLDIKTRMEKLAQHDQADKFKARIEELKLKHKHLGTQYEQQEYNLNLVQLFIKRKVHMLTSKINSKFKTARFKLFDTQINGGISECCEAITANGSPYTKTMSNGEKIKISLDICETLAKHYGINAPIFIDNAESVTDLLQDDIQQIRLIVSHHNELTVKDPIK